MKYIWFLENTENILYRLGNQYNKDCMSFHKNKKYLYFLILFL